MARLNDREPKPSRIVAFWKTLLGVHPSPVLRTIGKVLVGLLAVPVIFPTALIASLIWCFWWLGNRITKSTVALIESRYVD